MKCKNLNARYYLNSCISVSFNIILFSLFFLGFSFFNKDLTFLWGILVIFLGLTPLLIYYLFKFVHYQKILLTDIQEVTLERQTGNGKKFVGFNINMLIDGKKMKLKIKPIFTRSAGALCVSTYIHKKVMVGYHLKTNDVIVLGLSED